MSHLLELRGCASEPLIAYLKGLGIFRLVAEQEDREARAWWRNDTFMLRSALDGESLVEFFLEKYRPTPIVSPWNNRFRTGVEKGDKSGLDVLLSSREKRFSHYRDHIEISKEILEQENDKDRILAKCRTQFSDQALHWLDAVYVLTAEKPAYPPLTSNGGTLGTSGSGDISMNFAKNLVDALDLSERRRKNAESPIEWLTASVFGSGSPKLAASAGGQFSPGGWGPNSTVGFEADSLINPWDFLLMVEGTLAFAGAPVRRLASESRSKAVFPFTVNASPAGYSTSSSSEYASAKAEFWAPLWDRPSTLRELRHVASEGRCQLGRSQASNGAGFARAIAGLGVERGVESFQRFGFLQRTGRGAVFAASVGRLAVKTQRESNLLFDLDAWMQSLRGQARDNARLGTVFGQVEDAIIGLCQRGGPSGLQDVLIAVGRAERWVASSGLRENVAPLSNLSLDWLYHANDESVEFRLAKAMSSILQEPAHGKIAVGPIRWNLEPVGIPKQRLDWDPDSTSSVWTAGEPLTNMIAVLERRCLEGLMQGLEHRHPPLKGAYSARLKDIVLFLGGGVDAQRVAALALPLSFVRYRHRREGEDSRQGEPISAPFDLPTAYAVMKLTLLPEKFECSEFGPDADVVVEPSMLAMLRAGRVSSAYRVACRRLRASGLRPLSENPGIRDGSEQGRLLAAALLFPLDKRAYRALGERALRKSDRPETEYSG